MSPQAVKVDEFRAGMRRLAGGVNIITARAKSGPLGITATAVMSLSVDPPTALCCVNRTSGLESTIRDQKRYCINVLRAEHSALALRFAGQDGVGGSARFGQGTWLEAGHGAPALGDSLVTFECELLEAVNAYTHSLFIGLVTGVSLGTGGDPLVYCDGAFSKLEAIA